LIIGDDPDLFAYLEGYENTGNEPTFKERVIEVVRPKIGTAPDFGLIISVGNNDFVVVGKSRHEPPEQDEVKN
jgi:hypothetical protein